MRDGGRKEGYRLGWFWNAGVMEPGVGIGERCDGDGGSDGSLSRRSMRRGLCARRVCWGRGVVSRGFDRGWKVTLGRGRGR